MPRKAKDVAAGLTNKGFLRHEGDHSFYILWVEGKNTGIRTKISHGEKEIHDGLLAQMAKQVKLGKKDFLNLVDCPLTSEQYLELLRGIKHIPEATDAG